MQNSENKMNTADVSPKKLAVKRKRPSTEEKCDTSSSESQQQPALEVSAKRMRMTIKEEHLTESSPQKRKRSSTCLEDNNDTPDHEPERDVSERPLKRKRVATNIKEEYVPLVDLAPPSVVEWFTHKYTVWIIGSSHVVLGEVVAQQIFGENFGLDTTVNWFGQEDMRWKDVLPCFEEEVFKQGGPPDILVIHAGSNDLGLMTLSDLRHQMKTDLMLLHEAFPSMKLIYSCMTDQNQWDGKPSRVNFDRENINQWMMGFANCFNGEVVDHCDLEGHNSDLFLSDGINFSIEGNIIFLSRIYDVISQYLNKVMFHNLLNAFDNVTKGEDVSGREDTRATTPAEEKDLPVSSPPSNTEHVSDEDTDFPSERDPSIWIIGGSHVVRGKAAALEIFGINFGLDAKVKWFGHDSMRWRDVLPCFEAEVNKRGPPDVLVIHVGNNDLGLMPFGDLGHQIKTDLTFINQAFPSMKLVYSCMTDQNQWHGKSERVNFERENINQWMMGVADCFNGEVIDHCDLEGHNSYLFLSDGINFSREGNVVFLTRIYDVIRKILDEVMLHSPQNEYDNVTEGGSGKWEDTWATTAAEEKDLPFNPPPSNKEHVSHEDTDLPPERNPIVWIIGSSHVVRGKAAAFEIFGINLGLDAKVRWFGHDSLRWRDILPCVDEEVYKRGPPDVLVIHAGTNDLGLMPFGDLGLQMRKDLEYLNDLFPSVKLVYSCMTDQNQWYGKPPRVKIERRNINQRMMNVAYNFDGEVIDHGDLKGQNSELFRSDGINFSREGNVIFLTKIRDVVKKIIDKSKAEELYYYT